ncbi:MAG: DUF2061 domain-containing protein [Chitinophagales bacterium]|nr:DUF2061 domain-containing protein [Chitinophagales bacterium]
MTDNHSRSVVKGITWRIVGTLDTIFLSFLFTGNIGKALKIGFIELFTKIFLYYVHERTWLRMKFATEEKMIKGVLTRVDKHYRSVIKGVSWRFIGSLDTFWISYFVNRGEVNAVQTAFYIAATEVITKVLLYWLHERVWFNVNWGKKRIPVNESTSDSAQPELV